MTTPSHTHSKTHQRLKACSHKAWKEEVHFYSPMPQDYLPLEQGAISWTAVLETKGSEADTPAAPAGPQALLGLRRSTGS